jgi:2-keto-3-deoxy-L-rhamnonate aldolase RhmA
MFSSAVELSEFAAIVAGRVPLVPLLETAGALACLDDWISAPGVAEVFVGLNDLHVSLGCRFMFEPLVLGHVERVATAARQHGLRFGFGGIARVGEGLLPGQDVLAEHLRLGSQAVILSRTFNRVDVATSFEQAVAELRQAERALALRPAAAIEADRLRVAGLIGQLAELAGQVRQSA